MCLKPAAKPPVLAVNATGACAEGAFGAGPVGDGSSRAAQHHKHRAEWFAGVPSRNGADVGTKRALQSLLSCSLGVPRVDGPTVSFVVLAVGVVSYIRMRSGRSRVSFELMWPSSLLEYGQRALKKLQAILRDTLDDLRGRRGTGRRSEQNTPPPDAVDTILEAKALAATDASVTEVAEESPCTHVVEELVNGGDGLGDDADNHLGTESACTGNDAANDGQGSEYEAEELLVRRTPSPFQRFFDRLPALHSWTVVTQEDVPSSPDSSPDLSLPASPSGSQGGSSLRLDDLSESAAISPRHRHHDLDMDNETCGGLTAEEVEVDLDDPPMCDAADGDIAETDENQIANRESTGEESRVRWLLRKFGSPTARTV